VSEQRYAGDRWGRTAGNLEPLPPLRPEVPPREGTGRAWSRRRALGAGALGAAGLLAALSGQRAAHLLRPTRPVRGEVAPPVPMPQGVGRGPVFAVPPAAVAPAPPDVRPPEVSPLSPAPAPAHPELTAAPPGWHEDPFLEEALVAAVPWGLGRVAVAVRHLCTGATAAIGADEPMPPASIYKLGLLVACFRQIGDGRLGLEDELLITWNDYADGAGVLQSRIGERVTVGEALRLMVRFSDNVAGQVLLRRIGIDALNETYERLGMSRTRFFADARPDVTTAADVAGLLVLLGTGQLAPPEASDWMLDALWQDQPAAWIEAGLPPGTVVVHKSGQLPGIRNDAAIIYPRGGPYVLVVLADRLSDERAAEGLIGDLAAAVHARLAGA
jgi:beta-lactamase class A